MGVREVGVRAREVVGEKGAVPQALFLDVVLHWGVLAHVLLDGVDVRFTAFHAMRSAASGKAELDNQPEPNRRHLRFNIGFTHCERGFRFGVRPSAF